jgi:hypothetical protein
MDAMTQQNKMVCEEALSLIDSIRSAVRNGRCGWAKDCLVHELKPKLKANMGSLQIVFRKAYCHLPAGNTNAQDWEPGLYCAEIDLQSFLNSIKE